MKHYFKSRTFLRFMYYGSMTFVVISMIGFTTSWLKPDILNYSNSDARTAMIGFLCGAVSCALIFVNSRNLLKHQNKLTATELETKL